jgi:hypothetical protein
MIQVLGIDPGGTPMSSASRSATGWSLWEYDETHAPEQLEHGQVAGDQSAFIRWWHYFAGDNRIDQVICESFVDDGRTRFPDTTPLKVEGALEVLCGDLGIPLTFQRNVYKGQVPDRKVKELGWWWAGQGHAIDSGRHVWANLKVAGHMPTLLRGWPPPAI